MSISRSIREAIPPIHKAGYPFIAVTAAVAVLTGLIFHQAFFWLLAILTGWMVVFFRDPDRVTPSGQGLIISPADGRVEPIVSVSPPAELGLGPARRVRVSIFMNVFDCHVNRSPVDGQIRRIAYKPGKFFSADMDKASEDNERNCLLIDLENGQNLAVVQIAGLVARRILCWSREHQTMKAGERFGMIRFGSRLDVYLPDGATVDVLPGQRAVAGETVIAWLSNAALAEPGKNG